MVLEGFLSSITSQCDNTACVFDKVTMGSYLMMNTCYLLSYGAVAFDRKYKPVSYLIVNSTREPVWPSGKAVSW